MDIDPHLSLKENFHEALRGFVDTAGVGICGVLDPASSPATMIKTAQDRPAGRTDFFVFLGILVFSLAVIGMNLCLPRDSDDEVLYTALAAKISAKGLSDYNFYDLSIRPAGRYWKLSYDRGGNLLELLTAGGATYYQTGFYFNPPLYPIILSAAHRLLSTGTERLVYLVAKKSYGINFYPDQTYAAILNGILCAFFLQGLYFLGRSRLNGLGPLWAVVFCASSPIFLVICFKTWTELLCAGCLVWSFVSSIHSQKYRSSWLWSGVLFGLAALTRTMSLMAAPIFFKRNGRWMIGWTLSVLILCGYWFYRMVGYHGSPFYFPETNRLNHLPEWLESIRRPWIFYLLDLFYLSPVFVAAFWADYKKHAVMVVWFFLFLLGLSAVSSSNKALGVEDRYLFLAYPAVTVIAASGFETLRKKLPGPLTWIFLMVSMSSSIAQALQLIISRKSLHFVPF